MKNIKLTAIVLSVLLLASALCACGGNTEADDKSVVIYSSAEDYRNEYLQSRLNEQFPDYKIVIEYMPTGNHAAKILAEGAATTCDITFDMEYGYLEKMSDLLADLSDYDMSIFSEDLRAENKKYLPECRNGGCIAVNNAVLAQAGLTAPTTYEDLLDERYRGLISMPNPKSSGTGYMFLLNLVNVMGEDEAFEYFDKLSENILQFTTSGSGPVNALVSGEAGIGLAMTAQAVTEINRGVDLSVLYFPQGSPFSCYGMGIIAGHEERPAVKEVFDFFYNTLVREDKQKFFPEKIYINEDFTIENFPTGIFYADMSNNTPENKDRLLEKWKF